MSEQTLWLGRAYGSQPGQSRTLRVWTDGQAPGDDALVEVIADPFAMAYGDADARVLARETPTIETVRLGECTLAAPVRPPKILCIGRNYRAHAEEMGSAVPSEPLLFYKPSSALIGAGETIALPPGFSRIDMEAELVVVIGKRARAVSKDRALDHVAGYTLGNDVSCRDLQRSEKQWMRAKGYDTFAPLGPWVRVTNSGPLPQDARVQGYLDGELRQDTPLSAMVFGIPDVLAFISECMTLEPGDILFTGTPQGVSPLSSGQTTRVELQGFELGQLSNPIAARD